MDLHTPITRGRKRDFCGPTAIAAVTGLPLKEIRAAIIQQRDYKRTVAGAYWPIAGMNDEDLIGAMDLLGWNVVERWHWDAQSRSPRLLLGEFCQQRGNGGPFIVQAGNHYQAISNGEFCDTFTMTPIPLCVAVKPGKRAGKWVKDWWRFTSVDWDQDTRRYVQIRNTRGPVAVDSPELQSHFRLR